MAGSCTAFISFMLSSCNGAKSLPISEQEFGCSNVTVVGDRGMIKGPQIEQCRQENYHYISAISKPRIRKASQRRQTPDGAIR